MDHIAAANLTALERFRQPDNCDEVTATHDDSFENGDAVVGVVKGYSFNAADEGFWGMIPAGITPHFLKDPMRIFC